MNENAASLNWLEKALSLDLKGRCRLLWTEDNPFGDTIVKVSKQLNDPEKVFKVHKLIVAMGSQKFASELYDKPCPESLKSTVDIKPGIINIQTVSSSIMELVLEFIYSDAIQQTLDWPEVGGLLHASKQLGIPRLAEFCENLFQDSLNCEQILGLYLRITSISPTNENREWPQEYYLELMKLCYRYILRNGDVILCAKKFVDLSIENIESFIGSDFLLCDELTLFKALKRWSKEQCRKQGLDPSKIQNCRKVLKAPGDDVDESLGLLRHVRIPLVDSKTFTLEIHRSSRSLIPDKVAEVVYEYHTISEPQNIFSDKRRYTELEVEENLSLFEEEVEKLCGLFVSHDAPSNPGGSVQSMQSDPDSGTCSRMGSGPPSSSLISAVEAQGSRIIIKTEPNWEDENISQTEPVETKPSMLFQGPIRTPLKTDNHSSPKVANGSGISSLKRARKDLRCLTPVTPMKVKKVERKVADSPMKSSQRSNVLSSDSENEIYLRKNQKVKYTKIVEELAKRPYVTKIILEDIEIDEVSKMNKRLSSICLPNVTEYKVETNVGKNKRGNLIETLKTVNLEEFLFFFRNDERFDFRLKEVWANSINVRLSFNGVTVLDIRRPLLTINFTQKSSFFLLNSQMLTNIQSINLGNCTIDMKSWLSANYTEELLELRLLCVKGLQCDQVLRECPSLETVSIWPVDNQTPTLSLDSLKSENLRSLYVHGHMIKFNPSSLRQFVNVNELFFSDCSWDPSFVSFFSHIFPNLRKLSIVNRFLSTGPQMLSAFMALGSIEEIVLWNFDMKALNSSTKFKELKKLIANLNLKCLSNGELSFCVKRGSNDAKGWGGKTITREDLMKRIFKSFGFHCLYTFQAWAKYFWENYDFY